MPRHINYNVQAPLLENATLSSSIPAAQYDISREKLIDLEAVLCDILNRNIWSMHRQFDVTTELKIQVVLANLVSCTMRIFETFSFQGTAQKDGRIILDAVLC
jgi:hypothetical protein